MLKLNFSDSAIRVLTLKLRKEVLVLFTDFLQLLGELHISISQLIDLVFVVLNHGAESNFILSGFGKFSIQVLELLDQFGDIVFTRSSSSCSLNTFISIIELSLQ